MKTSRWRFFLQKQRTTQFSAVSTFMQLCALFGSKCCLIPGHFVGQCMLNYTARSNWDITTPKTYIFLSEKVISFRARTSSSKVNFSNAILFTCICEWLRRRARSHLLEVMSSYVSPLMSSYMSPLIPSLQSYVSRLIPRLEHIVRWAQLECLLSHYSSCASWAHFGRNIIIMQKDSCVLNDNR